MGVENRGKADYRVFFRAKTEEQKKRWEAAAKLQGMSFNAWGCQLLDQGATNIEYPKVGPRVMVVTLGVFQGQRLKKLTDLVRSIEAAYECEVFVASGDESSITVYDVPISREDTLNYHLRLKNIEESEEKSA